jgi:MoaA/NifB/PqqE/SkfB family radical SAM enzyme
MPFELREAAKSIALQLPPVRRVYDQAQRSGAENEELRSRLTKTESEVALLRRALGASHRFRKLQILLTSRCNLTCVMCNSIHLKKAALAEAEVRGLIEDGDVLGFDLIEISGGEPYYLKYFSAVIEDYAGKIAPNIRILSNAYSLDKELIGQLAGRSRLAFQVSFDGTRDVHNFIRVQNRYDAFSKSDENFRLLSKAGLGVSLQTVIQRHNVGNLLDTYRHFRDVPYKHHGFGIVEEGSWDYDNNCLLPVQANQLADELEQILAEAKADGQPVGIDGNMIAHLRSLSRAKKHNKQAEHFPLHAGYGCTVPFSIVIVDQEGLVYPCFHYHPAAGGELRDMVVRSSHLSEFSIKGRRLVDVMFSQAYIARSMQMTAIDGCEGCTTSCYFHDHDFARKCKQPTPEDIAQRDAQRDFLRRTPKQAVALTAE